MSKLHVVPVDDIIHHRTEIDDDCICGPTVEPVERVDGCSWLIHHHSLDGRERDEEAEELGRKWVSEE